MSFFTSAGSKVMENFDMFYKIIGPPLLAAVFLFGGLGYFILEMYKFNVTNKVEGFFPSQFAINLFFYFAIGLIVFILLILTFQTVLIKKYGNNNQRSESLPSGKSTPPTV